MGKPSASLLHKVIALLATFSLAFSMVPLAWADDAPAGTLAGSVAGNAALEDSAAESSDEVASGGAATSDGGEGVADVQAPGSEAAAEMQSADAKAADGSAGGTTISIAVYRSSFPIAKWDLNDQDFNLTKAEWAWSDRTGELPKDASPGSEVAWPESGKPADYAEPTRAGFEFAGWSTDKSASAGGFIDGSSPKLTMPEGAPTSDPKEYTLYALWTPLEYSVVFDLAKNPGNGKGPGSDASYALNWESADGVRTVISLGNGRFRVDGFTMKEADYDKATRTVGLPEPSRTGYRFLGWSEPDGQSLAMDNAAKDGFALNPVRLTQIDGTPVLTARWTSAFGVTAPLSITFGDYDKTGAPGNPWLGDKGQTAADDTTQAQQDKEGASEQEGYAKGGQAFFENTGWHEAIKLVGLTSERHASANQVLTTYDTKKASEAAVLGDGTEENPGERLLSLYPSDKAPTGDKSSGIHFRLTDAVAEADLGDAFTMSPQGEEGARKEISYGLNLSTDPTDGSANHGLVLPTNDYERKQIATVSYTFATATAANEKPIPECFYIKDGNLTYGLTYIKRAADDIALNGEASPYYDQFKSYLDSGMDPGTGDAQGFVEWGDGTTYNVRIIGINHDDKSDGSGKAGLTFQFVYVLDATYAMNPANTFSGGWGAAPLRNSMSEDGGTIWGQVPDALKPLIPRVRKAYNRTGAAGSNLATSNDRLFIPSLRELGGDNHYAAWNSCSWINQEGAQYAYWKAAGVTIAATPVSNPALNTLRQTSQASIYQWWTRSWDPLTSNVDTVCNGKIVISRSSAGDSAGGVRPCFAL